MNKYNFIFTDDSSVGLYNNEVNDIYHSKSGAYKEAMEKFILPVFSQKVFFEKTEIKILDICYGIGYNTKSTLDYISNSKILVDALEFDKELIQLSPFIKDSIKNYKVKIFLIYQLLKNDFLIRDINELVTKAELQFFDENIVKFLSFLLIQGYKYNPSDNFDSFLHNIYYNYISNGINCDLKTNKYNEWSINYYCDDARKSILSLKNIYDVVFLDAFSSQKDPTLWTIDFLSLVKEKMYENSILVSYSKSTPFRSALVELGFYVGKTFLDEVDMGTVASLNKENILFPLSEYDLQLISTRSGITYKDKNLNLSPSQILQNREIEQKNSNRISHTAFLKIQTK